MKKLLLLTLGSTLLLTSCVKKSLHEETIDQYEELIDELEADYNARLATAQNTIDQLNDTLDTSLAANAGLIEDIAEVNDALASTRVLLATANADIAGLETQITGLEEDIEALRIEVEEKDVSKLQAAIALVEDERDDAYADIVTHARNHGITLTLAANKNSYSIRGRTGGGYAHTGTSTTTVAYNTLVAEKAEELVIQTRINNVIASTVSGTSGNLADDNVRLLQQQVVVQRAQATYNSLIASFNARLTVLDRIYDDLVAEQVELKAELAEILQDLRD